MKIRLDSARFEPFRWQEAVAIAAADLDRPGLLAVGPVEVSGQLSFADPSFLLDLLVERDIPVIVITARDLEAEDRERLNSGVQTVLVKDTFRPAELVERIRRIVQGKAIVQSRMEAAS